MIELHYVLENQCTENNLVVHTIKFKSKKRLRKIMKMISEYYGFEQIFILNEIIINHNSESGWYILRKPIDDSHLKYYLRLNDNLRAKKIKKKRVFQKIYIFLGLVSSKYCIPIANNCYYSSFCSKQDFSRFSQQKSLEIIEHLPPNSRLGPRIKEWNDWDDYDI